MQQQLAKVEHERDTAKCAATAAARSALKRPAAKPVRESIKTTTTKPANRSAKIANASKAARNKATDEKRSQNDNRESLAQGRPRRAAAQERVYN